mgnify:CR=1 FL=1
MNNNWYDKICIEVMDNDCYAFKSWEPKNSKDICIVDVGANVGAFSIMAARKYPNAKIYSFEFIQENYDFASLKTLGYKNVTMFNKAMVGSNAPVGLFQHQTNYGGHKPIFGNNTETYLNSDRFTADFKQCPVQHVSFKDFLEENDINNVDFLKLDCEGSEYEILFHVDEHNLWNKISRISMELHGRDDQDQVDRLMEMLKTNYDTVNTFGVNMVHCE